MQYYKSKSYETMMPGMFSRNTFLILNDKEKILLGDKTEQLLLDLEEAFESGKLKRQLTQKGALSTRGKGWNTKDEEALVFIKRMCLWTIFPESENIDPTVWQIESIVNKMLSKIYGRHFGQFNNWMELWVDTRTMDSTDMRNRMSRKRSIVQQLKEEGLLPKGFIIP